VHTREYEVAIVGGGIIGASIALELAAEKQRVILIDSQEPGREASWAAAGMLSPAPDSPSDLPLVPLARESLKLYPRFIEAVEQASGTRAAYAREGALEIFGAAEAETECDGRLRQLREAGIAAEPISASAARKMESAIGLSARAALWLPEEGTVEPRALMDALLAATRNSGVEIRARCGVTGLLREGDRCAGVMAGGDRIPAEHVLLAAGCFSGEIANERCLKQFAPTRPVRGQMIALRPSADAVRMRCVVRSERGYLVPRADGRIVAGSTSEEAGFEKCVTAAGMQKILSAAMDLCPDLRDADIIEMWAGLRPGTPDDLPILGAANIGGLWMATGHYRNGILLAPATARLAHDWILGVKPTFEADAFSPMRFSHGGLRAQTAV
jgi:glycine oxidase